MGCGGRSGLAYYGMTLECHARLIGLSARHARIAVAPRHARAASRSHVGNTWKPQFWSVFGGAPKPRPRLLAAHPLRWSFPPRVPHKEGEGGEGGMDFAGRCCLMHGRLAGGSKRKVCTVHPRRATMPDRAGFTSAPNWAVARRPPSAHGWSGGDKTWVGRRGGPKGCVAAPPPKHSRGQNCQAGRPPMENWLARNSPF